MPADAPVNPAAVHFTQPFQMQLPHLLPIQQIQQVQVWQGQFPPPEAIERYVALQPDAFDRIIRMAEKGQDATIAASSQAMMLQATDTRRGQVLGFLVTAVAIAGAVALGIYGHAVVAGILVSVPVLSVANALIDSETARRLAARQMATENTATPEGEEES